MEITRRHRFDVPHPHLGRAVGVVWDMGIALLALLLIPAFSLILGFGLATCHWLLLPLTAVFMALALASILFGVLWVFRGCTISTCWLFHPRH